MKRTSCLSLMLASLTLLGCGSDPSTSQPDQKVASLDRGAADGPAKADARADAPADLVAGHDQPASHDQRKADAPVKPDLPVSKPDIPVSKPDLAKPADLPTGKDQPVDQPKPVDQAKLPDLPAKDLLAPDKPKPDQMLPDTLRPDGFYVCREAGCIPCMAPKPPAGLNPDRIVSAAVGDDAKADGLCIPFKTITKALVGLGWAQTVWVAPGRYDAANGESFPLDPPEGTKLIGDEANKGEGPMPTELTGQGPVVYYTFNATVSVYGTANTVGNMTVSGFKITTGSGSLDWGLYTWGGIPTVTRNTFYGKNGVLAMSTWLTTKRCPTVGLNVFNTSTAGVDVSCDDYTNIQQNTFNTPWSAVTATTSQRTYVNMNTFAGPAAGYVQFMGGAADVKSNTFAGNWQLRVRAGSVVRSNKAITGGLSVQVLTSAPDLGTAADPGNNDFGTGTILHWAGGTLYAIGNWWTPYPPVCSKQMDTNAGSSVIWGTGPGQVCP